jgi:putative intracellular protease/amidase
LDKRVLLVLTSQEALGDGGAPTGSWMEELASSYFALKDAGFYVTLTSPKGGAAPVDPASLQAPWFTEAGQRFAHDHRAQIALAHTEPLSDIDPADYAAIYFIGGAGTVFDFAENREISRLLAHAAQQAKPVASVCHAGCALLNDVGGAPFVRDRAVTVISDAEDALAGYDKLLPWMPEGRLRHAGADVQVGDPFEPNVVVDGDLITGQNPASAAPVASALVRLLDGSAH